MKMKEITIWQDGVFRTVPSAPLSAGKWWGRSSWKRMEQGTHRRLECEQWRWPDEEHSRRLQTSPSNLTTTDTLL